MERVGKRLLSAFKMAAVALAVVVASSAAVGAAAKEVLYSDDRFTLTAAQLAMFNGGFYEDTITQFNGGYAIARVKDRREAVVIDKAGKAVFSSADWPSLSSYGEGLVYASNLDTKKSGYIDLSGKMAVPCDYERCGPFVNGLAVVGYYQNMTIDKNGAVKSYDCNWLKGFYEGLSAAEGANGLCGYIDRDGKVVIDFQFAEAGNFHEGLAWVRTKEFQYGFIDKTGKLVIPYMYRAVGDFSEGLAFAITEKELNKLIYGGDAYSHESYYIDKSNNIIVCTMGIGSPFENGVAETGAGYIDRTGKVLFPSKQKVGSGIVFETGIELPNTELKSNGLNGGLAVERGKVGETYNWYVLELALNAPVTPKAGDKIGDVLQTDIKAYINGSQILACNIDGAMYVFAVDLGNYGFNTAYDSAAKTTTITLAKGKAFTPLEIPKTTSKAGDKIGNVLYTDIKAIINGKTVPSVNVDGKTAIPFAELKAFGEVKYDSTTLSSILTIK